MFERAIKRKVFLKLATTGPTGSGKSLSSLLMAKGMVMHLPERKDLHKSGKVKSRVCVIDSENESASLYANHPLLKGFFFDTATIHPPFTVQKYQAALDAAIKGGYDICIMDSISHAWAGDGGLLEKKEGLDTNKPKGGFSNWAVITKDHERFKSAILQSPIHIICTMRSKTEHLLIEENGKQKIIKAGMAPIQRDGIEYEFTTVLDFDVRNMATASKDRTGIFPADHTGKVTEETGVKIRAWLEDGEDAPPQQPVQEPSNEPHKQTNQRPQNTGGNGQHRMASPDNSRQQNGNNNAINTQQNSNRPQQSNQLKVHRFWTENPIRFEDSILTVDGKHKGKTFREIGHAELHRYLAYAVANAKTAMPKDFLELVKFVENWHETEMEAEIANSFSIPEEPTQDFQIAEEKS